MARLAVALVCCLLLAGCTGDDPEPRFSPTPTVVPTTTAVAPTTTTATVSPTTSGTATSPRQVVQQWVTAYNNLQETGDGADLLALAPSCSSCRKTVRDIRTAYRRGGYYRGGTWHLQRSTIFGRNGRTVGVRAEITTDDLRIKRDLESPVVSFPGGEVVFRFDTELVLGEWHVGYIEQEAT